MGIAIERKGDRLIARLSGEIDHHSAESIRSALDDEIAAGKVCELIMNFGNVSFMDSSGLGVVLGRYKKITSLGGKLCIENVPKRIERIFRMAGVYTLIERSNGGRNNG